MVEDKLTSITENKRRGREKELRHKIRKTLERYETVFKQPLSINTLMDFLKWSEDENQRVYLRDRLGVLSDQDCAYLRSLLKTTGADKDEQPNLPEDDLDDLETEEEEEEIDLKSLGSRADFEDIDFANE